MTTFEGVCLFVATAAGLSALVIGVLCIIRGGSDLPEPEPVIDVDQLQAELSMEFHNWSRWNA